MEEVCVWHKLARALGLGLACTLLFGACTEDITGGAACPSLCPGQQVDLKDTTIFPVSVDTTLSGYPPLGSEAELILMQRGDSLVTGAVIRYDTLSKEFPRFGSDTVVRRVVGIDSAFLSLTLTTTEQLIKDTVTFEVYDVDTTATDPDTAAVRPLFRPDRLLATRTVPKDSLTGTIRIVLPPTFILTRIVNGLRTRFGVAVKSDSSTILRILPSEQPSGPQLQYLARSHKSTPTVPDTQRINVLPRSVSIIPGLADYTIVLTGTPPPPTQALAVGGIPAHRVYLRFDVPEVLIDSTTIVRASLVMTQRPNRGVIGAADTTSVLPRVVIASNIVDPARSAVLAQDPLSFGVSISPIVTTPEDSGTVRLDVPGLLRLWRSIDVTKNQRAIVLVSSTEAVEPAEVQFFSTEATDASLRPRLRITYIPRVGFGLP
jgi:hypothetical protein